MRKDRYEKILSWLNRNGYQSQRQLARETGLSLGAVNGLLRDMEREGYLILEGSGYAPSEKGEQFLVQRREQAQQEKLVIDREGGQVRTAVILAAGNNSHFSCPEGLLTFGGVTVIDRILKILRKYGIEQIYMVIGAKEEQYRRHLKNRPVTLIVNPRYKWSGTMYSLSLTAPYVTEDFLLVECNQIFEEAAVQVMQESDAANAILVTAPSGSCDEAYVELGENREIFRISKDIRQLNRVDGEAVGISKISGRLFRKMMQYYEKNTNPLLNYEYVLEAIGRIYQISAVVEGDLLWTVLEDETHRKRVENWLYARIQKRERLASEAKARVLLQECLQIPSEDIWEVRTGGGMTNTNFFVTVKGERYILRIPGACTDEMIDRRREWRNSQLAVELGLNPESICFQEESGVKVTRCIPGAVTLNAKTARLEYIIRKTTAVMRTLHHSQIPMEGTFSVKDEYEKYKEMMEKRGISPYPGFDRMDRLFDVLMKRLEELGVERKPCHNDFVPENFVISKQGRMYLIDWEYSGCNDPMWDVASYLLECEFGRDEEELFLQYYFQRKPKREEQEKIALYKISQDILWSTWTMLKEHEGENFGTYGRDRLKRAARLEKEYEKTYGKR